MTTIIQIIIFLAASDVNIFVRIFFFFSQHIFSTSICGEMEENRANESVFLDLIFVFVFKMENVRFLLLMLFSYVV